MALNWTQLAKALGINVRTIQRLRDQYDDAPKTKELEDWKLWMAARHEAVQGAVIDDATELPGDCSYDGLVKAGKISYEQAEEREKVIRVSLANEAERVELAKKRGDFLTKEEAQREAAVVRDTMLRWWDLAVEGTLARLSRFSVEDRAAVSQAMLEAWDEAASKT